MIRAYIGLGSNLDAPEQQLQQAVAALQALPGSTLHRVSAVYRSSALGPPDQPDYCNAVAALDTALAPEDLLAALQAIERDQGRQRTRRWGPRTLDLDILLYGDSVIHLPHLVVPHPGLKQRDFVLYPLREISDTNLVLPDGSDLDTLLRHCPGNDLVRTECQLRISQ